MNKGFIKRLILGATLLFTWLLMRVLAPLLPPSDILGDISIGGLSFYVFDVLAWMTFFGFYLGVYFIFAKIIDQKMK
jgi:hypothetical protein